MNPLISVIVPIYNVEKYLRRCVDSIINQTYKNLEIILVDDGSPDNCPQICDEYAAKDSRVKVVHKPNGGLSDARNAGMKTASGEYISFVDSDDWVTSDFLECLLNVSNSENADIAECGVVKFYEDDNKCDNFSDDLSVCKYSTIDALSRLIAENPFHQHVWNKLYKRLLLDNIEFPVGKLNEDEFWTYKIFAKAQNIAKLNKTLYYYFQRKSSIMGADFNMRRLDALEAKSERQKFMDLNFPSLSRQSKTDAYGTCIFLGQSVLKYMTGADKKIAFEIVRKYKKEFDLTFDDIGTITGSSRKFFYLSKLSFYLCCKIRAITGVGF